VFVAIQALDLYLTLCAFCRKFLGRSGRVRMLYTRWSRYGVNLQGGYCDVTMKERTGLFATLTEGAGAYD
jgi:hypothetical protein